METLTLLNSLHEMEGFALKLKQATNALFAIHTATVSGLYSADEFEEGLYFIVCTFENYSKELENAVARAFAEKQEGKK